MRLLVTGTTGGIGGAVKRAALAAGHAVIEVNRGDFASFSSMGSPRIAPASQRPSVGGYDPIDGIVFTTGVCPVKPLSALTDAEFEDTFRVNCGLFVKLMRHVIGRKLNNPDGMRVVAISSVSAVEGWAGGAAYCASKGALSAVCRALDAELKPKRISVAALEPRYVKTRMFDACAGRMGVDSALATDPDEFAKEVLNECCR